MLTLLLQSKAAVALTATGIATGAPTVGTPAIGQTHALTATGIATGAPTVGAPAIGQKHALTATGITASPVVGTPAIGQKHALTATGITVSPVIGTPAIGQVHALSATGIATGAPTVGNPTLADVPAGTDALFADGIATGAPTLGSPVLSEIVVTVPAQPTSGGPGFALSFRQDRDWEALRKARAEVRAALEQATAGPRKKRKAAAAKAVVALEDIMAAIRQPGDDGWFDVLADIEAVQALLADMQARQAAEEWARIERELQIERFLEEELLVVLALAC